MPFVLDASVAVAWCFEDEASPYAESVLASLAGETALAPCIWPLEVANALTIAERRRRLSEMARVRFVELLPTLPIALEEVSLSRALGSVLTVARSHHLSAYDASYLELAMREGLLLATQDAHLAEAATALGVPLLR